MCYHRFGVRLESSEFPHWTNFECRPSSGIGRWIAGGAACSSGRTTAAITCSRDDTYCDKCTDGRSQTGEMIYLLVLEDTRPNIEWEETRSSRIIYNSSIIGAVKEQSVGRMKWDQFVCWRSDQLWPNWSLLRWHTMDIILEHRLSRQHRYGRREYGREEVTVVRGRGYGRYSTIDPAGPPHVHCGLSIGVCDEEGRRFGYVSDLPGWSDGKMN